MFHFFFILYVRFTTKGNIRYLYYLKITQKQSRKHLNSSSLLKHEEGEKNGILFPLLHTVKWKNTQKISCKTDHFSLS